MATKRSTTTRKTSRAAAKTARPKARAAKLTLMKRMSDAKDAAVTRVSDATSAAKKAVAGVPRSKMRNAGKIAAVAAAVVGAAMATRAIAKR
ncbi:MAG TPA: hypothetical protein VGI92_11100 [Gemmatimonadales bacterium]|jgi:hypothetical protein